MSVPFIVNPCIDIFVAILYVWEYYYQFVKFQSVLIDKKPLHYGK